MMNRFIYLEGKVRHKKVDGVELRIHRLTKIGREVLEEWLGNNGRVHQCPFSFDCTTCNAIIKNYNNNLHVICPCYLYGVDRCEKFVQEMLKRSNILRVANIIKETITDTIMDKLNIQKNNNFLHSKKKDKGIKAGKVTDLTITNNNTYELYKNQDGDNVSFINVGFKGNGHHRGKVIFY